MKTWIIVYAREIGTYSVFQFHAFSSVQFNDSFVIFGPVPGETSVSLYSATWHERRAVRWPCRFWYCYFFAPASTDWLMRAISMSLSLLGSIVRAGHPGHPGHPGHRGHSSSMKAGHHHWLTLWSSQSCHPRKGINSGEQTGWSSFWFRQPTCSHRPSLKTEDKKSTSSAAEEA